MKKTECKVTSVVLRSESLLYRNMIAAAVVLVVAVCCANTKTWRDSNGRILGTERTDSMGRTTYRDLNGMLIGTARTDGNEFYLFFGRYKSVLGSS